MGEFDLIARFFKRPARHAALGIGDDCALLQPAPGTQLAISCDMLVAGRHFFADVSPHKLGHKALAVNLSDLAAMGAAPMAFTLALALPRVDEAWLAAFAEGLLALADAHGCALVGGDTTAGPLNLCLTVFGQVPAAQALRRDAAQAGDDLYVSGTLGDACLALTGLLGQAPVDAQTLAQVRGRLERPTPRVALGLALRGVARACADLSDGLLGDLGHILQASHLAAELEVDALLASAAVSSAVRALAPAQRLRCVLAGGDDYELVFSAPPTARAAVQAAAQQSATPVTRIGRCVAAPGGSPRVRLCDRQGQDMALPAGLQLAGYDHFA